MTATWQEVCDHCRSFGGELVGSSMLMFDIDAHDGSWAQKVFIMHETIKPDYEILKISSPVGPIQAIDTDALFVNFGQMLAGDFAYTPFFDDNHQPIPGMVTFSTTVPLAMLDLSDPYGLGLYVNILAGATNNLTASLGLSG